MKQRSTRAARSLRRGSTDAERVLWQRLRTRQVGGAKFRRQYPLGRYIVDFVCLSERLVVEVDGGQHADSVVDRERDHWLAEQGYRVLRFWNNDVLARTDAVLAAILEVLTPHPSLRQAQGRLSPTRGKE
ncbi:MAG: endonuclease domain-containing protein [bacterium]